MEVRAAEAVGADAGAAGRAVARRPLAGFVDEVERRAGEVDVGVGRVGVKRRRQALVVQGQGRFQQPGRARPGLQVADVALGRAEADAAPRGRAEHGRQALYLDHVADAGAGPVGLDECRRGRVEPGRFPGALHGQLLADRVGGGDALALAVAGAGHAADDGINLVTGPLGVFESLQQERPRAFAHDEAIGPVAERARAGRAERADLAELDERRRAHVAVNAAGQHRVHLVFGQQLDGRLDSGEAAGAGGVGDEVRSAQVQDVGDAAGDDVGQLARHRVLGDGRQILVEGGVELLHERRLDRRREPLELRRAAQPADIFGKGDALGGDVVEFAAHGCAHDDAGALGVERPLRVTVVGQRVGGDGDGPLLAFVHGRGDLGRHAEAFPVELEVAHPTPDLAVGLIGRLGVGVVVVSDTPAVGRRFGDAVALADDVVPESGRARRIGQDGPHPDDSDSAIC